MSVVEHPRLGGVTIVQSPRARRISLSVRAAGEVRLTYPRRVSQKRALEFLEQKVEWALRARERMAARRAALPQTAAISDADRKRRIEELRRLAKADLPLRVERISKMLGLPCKGLTIRASRTKWGSCTSRNTISLSLFLMALPEHLRDYVIVHELCHTVHHNHSARFHALVDRCLGGREKELAKELKSVFVPEMR